MKTLRLLSLAAVAVGSVSFTSCCSTGDSAPPKLRDLPQFSNLPAAELPVSPSK